MTNIKIKLTNTIIITMKYIIYYTSVNIILGLNLTSIIVEEVKLANQSFPGLLKKKFVSI